MISPLRVTMPCYSLPQPDQMRHSVLPHLQVAKLVRGVPAAGAGSPGNGRAFRFGMPLEEQSLSPSPPSSPNGQVSPQFFLDEKSSPVYHVIQFIQSPGACCCNPRSTLPGNMSHDVWTPCMIYVLSLWAGRRDVLARQSSSSSSRAAAAAFRGRGSRRGICA